MIARIITLTIITVTISALPLKLNEENSSLLAEDGLFEGDLKIPESFIRAHYNLSEMDDPELGSNRSRRAAAANNLKLWVDGIIPYIISYRFSSSKRAIIRDAMARWEDTTCLRFVPHRSYHRDYIYFQDSDSGCYSYVGRQGGRQIINLQRNSCERYGTILHEITHAIGFWHEQSRPDRDNYVRIITNNIKSGQSHNFMKRKDSEVDSLGSSYDYGSIMHYSKRAFVNWWCFWCKTIEVTNSAAYKAQGSPSLGQRNDLSPSDIQQTNTLYSCPISGVLGTLTVKVKYGRNLKDTDGWWNLSDPYVEIIAVDYLSTSYRQTTQVKSGTLNPTWNKTLRFSLTHWQFFRIRVWDSDLFSDDAMSMSETVIVSSGHHNNQKHCHDTRCEGYIMYDYSLL